VHRLALIVGVTAALVSCAEKVVAPAAPATPRHPELLYLRVPDGTLPVDAELIEHGWRYLQSDDLRNAERTFHEALKRQPGFHPAETGLGYIDQLERDFKEAVAHFDMALKNADGYVPALVSRGEALLQLQREGDALASFEAALKRDPTLKDLQGRIDVLRLRALQDNVERARGASEAGRWDEARAAYLQAISASPDSAFLYRDLGMVDRKAGDTAAALEHLRKALEIDPNDARAHAQIGGILEERNDIAGAIAEYEKAALIDPAEVPNDVLVRARDRVALEKMPQEYRAIPSVAAVSRADVAALIGVRLPSLLTRTRPRQVVVTDVRNNWAQQWILNVVQSGVMDTQPNYTFQPTARVRRGDMAQTVARLLALVAAQNANRARVWESATPNIADVPPAHLNYPAVSQAVASGVMSLQDGAFDLLRPVTGSEAVQIVSRLETLAKP
jgi:tetratricopeptide (TPR) repeat protein